MNKENEKVKLSNFKRFGFSKIWSSPENIELKNLDSKIEECKPKDFNAAFNRVIKDIGVISSPDIETTEKGKTIYSFSELKKEKVAIEKYRASVDVSRLQIGKTVFDTGN
jgi:hypothetical protein